MRFDNYRLAPCRCFSVAVGRYVIGRFQYIKSRREWCGNHTGSRSLDWYDQVGSPRIRHSYDMKVFRSHPKPFKCSIKPRSAKALELIQQNPYY